MSRGDIIVVVGMLTEAAIVAGLGITVVVSGGQADTLGGKLAAALADGAQAVVSFGICGGLNPGLRVGDLVVASSDSVWRDTLKHSLGNAHSGKVTGGDVMVASQADKAALYAQTGSDAVDMESHIVMACGAPWAIIRAVSDPAAHALPRSALVGLNPDGSQNLGAVLRSLAIRPWELPALVRTGREAGAALRSLRNARDLLGPRLGRLDLGQHLVNMA